MNKKPNDQAEPTIRNGHLTQITYVMYTTALRLLHLCYFVTCLCFSVSSNVLWIARPTRYVEVVGSSPIKAPVISLIKTFYPYCLVPVCSRNGFERDFTIELK